MKKTKQKRSSLKKQNRKERRLFILFLTKLGLGNASVAQKIEKARHIIGKLTDNPNFPTTTPTVAAFTIVTDTLETAQAAMDGNPEKTALRDEALTAFMTDIKQLQADVET